MTTTQPVRQYKGVTLNGMTCKGCGSLIGYTSPHVLILGGAVFKKATSIFCVTCERRWVWNPSKKNGMFSSRRRR